MTKAPPWHLRGQTRAASRQNPNPLIVFFEISPAVFLEVEKGVGFVGITLLVWYNNRYEIQYDYRKT